MASPFSDLPISHWKAKTDELISKHPLELESIRAIAIFTWNLLWETQIGHAHTFIPLAAIDPPATVIGYFFEKLFAKELERRYPSQWRGSSSKDEKDLVYLPNLAFSIEMKTSGQLGSKIFGNRSYNQRVQNDTQVLKVEKSGYYITINFYKQCLTLIRFGWIDADDWKPQKSQTGQAATLSEDVYRYKLIEIPGDYQLDAPASILEGVGPRRAMVLTEAGILTIRDILEYNGSDMAIQQIKEKARKYRN